VFFSCFDLGLIGCLIVRASGLSLLQGVSISSTCLLELSLLLVNNLQKCFDREDVQKTGSDMLFWDCFAFVQIIMSFT
jgi:hypothetical protein